MVVTLTGQNEFAIKQALAGLVDEFVGKFGLHGHERVDGETFEPRNLASLLQGASLFAPERLVVVRDAARNKPLWEALGEWASNVPAETTLVIVEPTIDKRTKTYKTLKNSSNFKEFGQPSDGELVTWLLARATELGVDIARADTMYLVQRTAGDQWRLSQELEKLANHTPITRQLIDELVEPSPEGTAFELLDAALAGNSQKVTVLVVALKYQEDPYKLFGLLASQVHTLAIAAAAGTRAADQIAGESGLHPFVVRRTIGVAQKLGQKRVKQIIEDVATCDMQLKSTGADPWQLLELALQKIAT